MLTGETQVIPPLTLPYKHAHGQPILLGVYPPNTRVAPSKLCPAVVYFHGGGLTVGNRHSWFPSWLCERLAAAGTVFISADYQLIPPGQGRDLVADIQDLFNFLKFEVNQHLAKHCIAQNAPEVSVDSSRIAVAGTSAGGLCAYLAAIHASPKPVAVLAMYAMGGNFLTPHYLSIKTKPFFRGREILDPAPFQEFLYPHSGDLVSTSDSALAYHPPSAPIPNYPANPRMLLARLYLQLGVFLDYYTGAHEPSLSNSLRGMLDSETDLQATLVESLPFEHIGLFPHLQVTPNWPPTLLVHGEKDTAVSVSESQHMLGLLRAAGVDASLKVVEGQEHSFDYAEGAEALFGTLFGQVATFLREQLSPHN